MQIKDFIKDITIHVQDPDTNRTRQIRLGDNIELLRYIANLPNEGTQEDYTKHYYNIKDKLNKRGSKGYGISLTLEEFTAIKERTKEGSIQDHFKECLKSFKPVSLDQFREYDNKPTALKEHIITIYVKGAIREKIEAEAKAIGTTPNKIIRYIYFKWLKSLKAWLLLYLRAFERYWKSLFCCELLRGLKKL